MASSKTDRSQTEVQKNNAWKFFLALAIIAAVFIGMYWFKAWQAEQTAQENQYNGFDFRETGEGLWVTEIQSPDGQAYFIPFYYHPRELEDVTVHAGVQDILLGAKPAQVYIALDPDAGSRPVVGGVEISRITGSKYNLLNIPTKSALTRPADREVDVPIVNCNNASAIPNSTVVIQFVQDPEANAIVRDEQCILLFYQEPEDSIRVADTFAYMMLQIMRPR